MKTKDRVLVAEYDCQISDERRPLEEFWVHGEAFTDDDTADDVSAPTFERQQSSQTSSVLSHTVAWCSTSLYSLKRSTASLFLPVDYPHSVADGYAHYQFFDSVQGLCSYVRGVVTSAHVLHAAGVGSAEATAWGTAVTWAIKDGTGLVGGLLFSSWAAPRFDGAIKEFRFFADLINNVGLTLDMFAPNVAPNHFWILASVSTLCKTLCGLSAGATKGSISQHFAVQGNLADVHAKEGSQETAVNLVGMVAGILVGKHFQQLEDQAEAGDMQQVRLTQWVFYSVLTLLHVWANYQAVQGLRLRTLNRERATAALYPMIQQTPDMDSMVLAPPEEVHESLLASATYMLCPRRFQTVVLGARLKHVLEHGYKGLITDFWEEKHLLSVTVTGQVLVSLHKEANRESELLALLHALLVRAAVCKDTSRSRSKNDVRHTVRKTLHHIKQLRSTGKFVKEMQDKGWIADRLYLGYAHRRSQWQKKDS